MLFLRVGGYKQQPTELEMEVELNCSHCFNDYSDDNPPRMLISCGHTFCERCLNQFVTNQQGKTTLRCPDDQLVVDFSGNVQNFPKNLTLMKYLDGRAKNNSLSFKEDSLFDVSKIAKSDELQQDEDAKQLITVIDGKDFTEKPPLSKEVVLAGEDPTQSETSSLLTEEVEVEMCLLHQKPIEVVCVNDRQRLCSKCAIFGQHKGHDFRSLEEIDTSNKKFYQQILSIFEQKTHIYERSKSKMTETELIQILAAKGSKVRKEISDKFRKMMDQLAKTEKLAYKRLQEMIGVMQKKLKRLLVHDDKISSAFNTWESTSLQKINLNETHSHEGTFNFYLEGNQIVAAGNEILNKLKQFEEKAITEAGRFIDDMGVNFNEGNVITALHNMVDIYESELERKSFFDPPATCASRYKENEKFLANREQYEEIKKPAKLERLHESDESLLEFDEFDDSKSTTSMIASRVLEDSYAKVEVQKEETVVPSVLNMSKEISSRPPLQKKKISIAGSKDLDKSKDMSQTQASLSSGLGKEAIKKKLRSLKIPEKYEKVVEGVMADTLDTVDFTNAELGDNTIIQICDLMKNNSRVKTLKLIRNKLTDEGVCKILPFMTGISTLNLSQNLLTEQCLNFITDIRPSLPQLKAVILSQNKIVQRKSKMAIEKLRKMDLTVSI